MLSAILFAACFSNKTSLIALVATECPSLLNQSHWNFFMIQAQYVSIIYHIKDPPVVFSPRLFALSLLQLEVDLIHVRILHTSITALMATDISKRFIHPVT